MNVQHLLLTLVTLPGAVFFLLGLAWLLGGQPSERAVSRITKATYGTLALIAALIGWQMLRLEATSVQVEVGSWFQVGGHSFPLAFMVDRLSLPIIAVTVLLVGLVGAFSVSYLHRDPGFLRFFLLLHLFAFGALLVFSAASLDLLIGGWEIVGITSVLLISFFQYRPDPVRNALRVFGTYRVADLFMLVAVFMAHHAFHSASWQGLFTGQWPDHVNQLAGTPAAVIAVLLVFAASGKSAQGPFCGWLARAMEGPTPSSAIFYGAISVHAGPYLLLRVEPLIRASSLATGLLLFIGITTAVLATMVHRTCADAKTSLAYASQTQLGIIFAEIGLGWTTLALVHIIGHAAVRTMQILRTPSMLRDHHRVHAAAGGQLDPTGGHYESLLPRALQTALYRIALGRGFYDALVDRFLIRPVRALAGLLGQLEPQWVKPTPHASRQPAEPPGALTQMLTPPKASPQPPSSLP